MKLKLTGELWKEGNMYVSYCPELDIASCGKTVEQAKKNLKEVILINLEEAQKLGTLGSVLEERPALMKDEVFSLCARSLWASPPLKSHYDIGNQTHIVPGSSAGLR
jgi:predicted RNase H-like HicB family nuclease